MSERLETLKKARARMTDDRDAFAKILAAPFDRDKAERARIKFIETQAVIDRLRTLVARMVMHVAEASGKGFLGTGQKVSPEERACMEHIAAELRLRDTAKAAEMDESKRQDRWPRVRLHAALEAAPIIRPAP